ncbi:MAG TPA: DUF3267 domain-containing protein [Anaerolineales bacterium]|nr:DUF3267 domain-containing protein [Anaerolineales bacterium]
MHATKDLLPNYHQYKNLDFSSPRTALWLNLAAVPLLFLYGWLFSLIINFLRSVNPSARGVWGLFTAFSGLGLVALLVSIILMLILHEAIHGACFWIFTGERPKFALKAAYAYAAAPDWYLPRNQYAVVGLSPFVVISVLSMICAAFLPSSMVPYLIYIATFNAAGALGDMIVVGWVLSQPTSVIVQDKGDRYIIFEPDRP